MPTPYAQQTWTDGSAGGTPISAARLGYIEQGIQDVSYPQPNYVRLQDEFSSANTEDGEIGEMGWMKVNSGTGSMSYDPGITDHMGLLNVSSGGTTGNLTGIALCQPSAGNGFILPAQIDRAIWIGKTGASSASLYRFGLCQDPSVTACGTDGVWWDYSAAANANWRSVSRGSSANTTNNTAVAVTAGNWYKLEIRRNGSGNFEFWLNEVLKFTHTTNLPGAAVPLIPFAVVETSANAAKTMDVDYFGFMSVALGQRWT